MTVRFLLSRVDTQFGWALASPAASIVDEEVYDADQLQAAERARSSAPARSRWTSSATTNCELAAVRRLHRPHPGPDRRLGLPHGARLGHHRGRDDQGRGRRGLARAERRRGHPAAASRSQQSPEERTAAGFTPDRADRHPGAAAAAGTPTRGARRTRACGRRSPRPCRTTAPRTRSCPAASPATCRASRSAARPSPRSPGRTGST